MIAKKTRKDVHFTYFLQATEALRESKGIVLLCF
jgi:hypothetical protein